MSSRQSGCSPRRPIRTHDEERAKRASLVTGANTVLKDVRSCLAPHHHDGLSFTRPNALINNRRSCIGTGAHAMQQALCEVDVWPSSNGFLGRAAHGQSPPRQLSRRPRQLVALQQRYECIYCIVDLHAITVSRPAELPKMTREVAAAFIACGIDPKKNIVFNQSQVAEHAELAWVFNCVARLGWLNRMTQFKEKAGKDRENASVGRTLIPL